ncbi:MAG: 3'-5' exonuclease [Campylobacteraceae bacterium]|jgi:DNA polymerase-3 subunit epsilon|nr:3'-5' exonuclease [Campylobacteraceae bacterium]
MFESLKRKYLRGKLKDKRFDFVFDEPRFDEYVAFDCETTGLNPKKDEVISIGAVKIRGNRVLTSEKFEVIVRPKNQINKESIKVHHIRNCDVENGISSKEALERFLDFIGNRALVGYYLEFDVAMINKYMTEFLGTKLPNPQIEVSALYFDKKNDVFGSKNVDLRFEAIMKDLNLPLFGQHSAYYDALMTALIFVKLSKKHAK